MLLTPSLAFQLLRGPPTCRASLYGLDRSTIRWRRCWIGRVAPRTPAPRSSWETRIVGNESSPMAASSSPGY